GLELPATSLIEPFLADIDASSLALLDTTFSISLLPSSPAGFDGQGDIREKVWLATRYPGFPGQKWPENARLRGLAGVVDERPTPFGPQDEKDDRLVTLRIQCPQA